MRAGMIKLFGVLGLTVLAGCAPAPGAMLETQTLAKGELVPMRTILARHSGQYGCVNYRAANDSCESLMRFSHSGTRIVSRDVLVYRLPGQEPGRLEAISQGRLEGNQACVNPGSVELVQGGLSPALAQAAVGLTNQMISDFGGVCATYYATADGSEGYVVTSRGRNGRLFPPGDVTVRFFDTPKGVRVQ